MKSTEIVQEGPLDFAGKAAAYVGGALSQTQTGKAAYNRKAAEQATAERAKRDFAVWNQQEAALTGKGVAPSQMGPYFNRWIQTQYQGVKALPPFAGTYSDQAALAHIAKALNQQATADIDAPEAAAPEKTAEPGTAPAPAAGAAPAAPAPAAGAATPAATPAADPTHAMFKDPAAFKAEWDRFIASKPNYKLIADPQLLSTLKNMWMRTGGMKAESKKNKGKRV